MLHLLQVLDEEVLSEEMKVQEMVEGKIPAEFYKPFLQKQL